MIFFAAKSSKTKQKVCTKNNICKDKTILQDNKTVSKRDGEKRRKVQTTNKIKG